MSASMRPRRMKRRLFLYGLGLAIVLLAVGGWTVQALQSLPGFKK